MESSWREDNPWREVYAKHAGEGECMEGRKREGERWCGIVREEGSEEGVCGVIGGGKWHANMCVCM